MGLDVYFNSRRDEGLLATLDVEIVDEIHPILVMLEARTGTYIDPYGSTRLSPDHALVLRKLLVEAPVSAQITRLIGVLTRAVDDDLWLLFAGD